MAISGQAKIEDGVIIGRRVTVWDFCHIRHSATIDDDCVIGEGVYIGAGVIIGARSKIQNNALIYEGSRIGQGVFIGPGAILTNDHNPRAVTVDGTLKTADDWQKVGVEIQDGAAIGAGVVVIAPSIVGGWAMVGAGSIVTKEVKNFALVVGNPAIQIGWVGKSGARLVQSSSDTFTCPVTKAVYELSDGELSEKPNI